MRGDDIAERLVEFGARVLEVADQLPATAAGRHVGGQVLRCGTAPGAHYEEGRGAESRADFIHKLSLAWKELRESTYWLKLAQRSKLLKPELLADLLKEAHELCAIFNKSLETARKNDERRK